jgi:hypothetical protein
MPYAGPSGEKGSFGTAVTFIVCLGLPVCIAVLSAINFFQIIYVAKSYQVTTARIEHFQTIHSGGRFGGNTYKPYVSYEADGKRYGVLFDYHLNRPYEWLTLSYRFKPKGDTISIYYNPRQPEKSLYFRWGVWPAAALMLCLPLGVFFFLERMSRPDGILTMFILIFRHIVQRE